MLNTYISSANMETIWYKMVGSYGQYYSSFQLSELDLYGAKRLGVIADTLELNTFYFNGSYNAASNSYNISSTYSPTYTASANNYLTSFTYGKKQYEITNHLGNVLSTVSDYKLPYLNSTGKLCYNPDVRSENKYYAFGGAKDGFAASNLANVNNNYRFSFNGKPDDKGTGLQDYGMRMYDDEIGRFISVDPIAGKFPFLTPFQFAGNTTIQAIDLDGLEVFYNTEGKKYTNQQVVDYLNIKVDPKNTNVFVFNIVEKPVCTVNTDVTTTAKIPNIALPTKVIDLKMQEADLLNRAQWAYGEGGGQLLDYYAHTINNLSKCFKTDEKMYKGSMSNWQDLNKDRKAQQSEIICLYPEYLNGKGTPGSNDFLESRKSGKFTDIMSKAISETIKARLKLSADPTKGANQWRGGDVAVLLNKRRIEKTYLTTDGNGNIVKEDKSKYQTIFFDSNKK